MTKYYRGHLKRHADFWVSFRELPKEARFNAFVQFFNDVVQEVDSGTISLRDAGYAVKPGFYDEDIYRPREADLSFAVDAVEDLIVLAESDPAEAGKIWDHIKNVMGPYL